MKYLHKWNLSEAYPDHSFKHCSLPQNKQKISLTMYALTFSSYYL